MSPCPKGWGALALVVSVWACVASGQQLNLMQGINHPAGPQFGQPDVALAGGGRQSLDAFAQKDKERNSLPSAPKDALVDPDGREFKITIRRKPEHPVEECSEPKIFEEPLKENATRVAPSAWFWSFIGCACVVACGILPAFLLPIESGAALQGPEGKKRLNLLLSFAVGSLLGDV
uniref:Uncharacterized protein n=1 Tax=Plectus sambesii TaxID=2011161 RepID=A0A914WYS9_9BILA